jgi:chemotaxis protein histidine kinase CheA
MAANNDDLPAFLSQAKAEYRASLTSKLDELENIVLALESDPANRDQRRKLFDTVHRISGSAGSFGLDAIGNIADEWERKLRELNTRAPARSDFTAMSLYISRIREEI